MKHSIKKQFSAIFILLMILVIFMCWLTSTFFLEKYYLKRKVRVIYNAYVSISKAVSSKNYNKDEFQNTLDRICNTDNIVALVIDSGSGIWFASENGGNRLELVLYSHLFGEQSEDKATVIRDGEETGEDYILQRIEESDSEYLEMYGRMESGAVFIMRSPIESMRESAQLANTFFLYIGAIGSVLGGFIIWIVTGRVIRPILDLNHISERMVDLDFDVKYQGKTQNEIGLLGENMNKLSGALEKSISGLKTANNELKRDIEKKERIDEMRREFLSNVSHELKTPIALIRGYAEGLQEGIADDPESRDYYCDVIVDEAKKMSQMVQKLLTLNQLEFGNNQVDMERFDVTALIKNAIQSGELLAENRDIHIEFEPAPAYFVWADAFMVEEVFQNYFSNALHYCSKEKKIRVSLKQENEKVRISVFNTGNPIPDEALPRIWDKFYKVDKARTREYGGSGVGLSIVKAIMDALHQQYGVMNCENGVLFWFELESAAAGINGDKEQADDVSEK